MRKMLTMMAVLATLTVGAINAAHAGDCCKEDKKCCTNGGGECCKKK